MSYQKIKLVKRKENSKYSIFDMYLDNIWVAFLRANKGIEVPLKFIFQVAPDTSRYLINGQQLNFSFEVGSSFVEQDDEILFTTQQATKDRILSIIKNEEIEVTII